MSTILALLLQAAPLAGSLPPDQARFDACIDLAIDDPASGVVAANEWLIEGGTYFARHCLGFAHAHQQRWDAAEKAFVEAARAAMAAKDDRAGNLWTQAGNAALAGGSPQAALSHFDAALAQATASGLALGEIHLDRARALVALGNLDAARAEFDIVHKVVPEDPLGWLLSATLARRQGDLTRAQADIAVAAKLASRDSDVALEAGNIAVEAGDYGAARRNWQQAVAIAPDSKAAATARDQLGRLDEIAPADG